MKKLIVPLITLSFVTGCACLGDKDKTKATETKDLTTTDVCFSQKQTIEKFTVDEKGIQHPVVKTVQEEVPCSQNNKLSILKKEA